MNHFTDFYIEPSDPSSDHNADWNKLDSSLYASIGSIDVRYPRSSIPDLEIIRKWRCTAWRGEKTHLQVVMWSREPVNDIYFEFTDFEDKGQVIPGDFVQARFVRYVLTDEFGDGDGCADRKPEDFPAYLSPDVLDNVSSFDMAGCSTRPVWVSIKVPEKTKPGEYTGTMVLNAKNRASQEFKLMLQVQSRVLPSPREWKFHLDLWQHPYAAARLHGVELWSPEHWEVMTPLMRMLAEAGQKVITTTINARPWGNQALDGYESMVRWIRREDGSWSYDYTVFDNWVEFMMSLGIDKQINAYSLIPWTSELVYFDEEKSVNVVVKVETGSQEYIDLWSPFIVDFKKHLMEKGWINHTLLAMDEIKGDSMVAMLDVMDDIAPEFMLASADSEKAYKRFPDRIRDLTVTYAMMIDGPDLEYRKERGYLSTFYVCCREPYPNQFTFSPPVESAFMGWYSIANGFDGFLRWAYAHWVENPLIDTRFRKWPGGDTNFVYPGPRSSIRFERLIEGIQDAEKVSILREEFKASGAEEKLNELEEMLSSFS